MSEKYIPDSDSEREITAELFAMRDEKYRDFHAKLIPTVDKERIIGIRTPQLRKYAKSLKKDGRADAFLSLPLPLYYYEQMNLYAFLIEQEQSFDSAIRLAEHFIPHIDNWATCDMFSPKVFAKNPDRLLPYAEKWLADENTYTVRYGIVTFLSVYLDKNFDAHMLESVSAVKSEEFYVNMAVAWYFSMALAKHYEAALPYIKNRRLSDWTHNKTIQKACESRQISEERKAYLKTLKIPKKR